MQLSPDVAKVLEDLRQEINQCIEDQSQRSETLKVVDAIEDQLKSGSPNSTVVDALVKALPPVGNIASITSPIWQLGVKFRDSSTSDNTSFCKLRYALKLV